MASRSPEWWKGVPCHFTWHLEDGTEVDHETLKTNVEGKLLDWPEEHSSPPCQPLLLLGFLNVSKFDGLPKQNPKEAIKSFKKVEKETDKLKVEEEKKAFRIVALANQIWCKEILNQPHDGTGADDTLPADGENDEDVGRLKQLWDSRNERTAAYIEGIAVFALARLGSKKYKEGEERCRRALRIVPDNPEWHYNLGRLISKQIRHLNSREYDHINDAIKCYKEAVELDPKFDLARCELGLALVKVPNRKKEAFEHIEIVQGESRTMVIKKGRFYRFQREYKKALEILKKGESAFDKPRGELFFQISLIYSAFAYQAGSEKKWTEKNKNLEKQIEYTDKCLAVDPRHEIAMIKVAQALGSLRRNDEAEARFEKALEALKGIPNHYVEAAFTYAEFLTTVNRKQVTPYAAKLYKDAIATALTILHDADDGEVDGVKLRVKKFVTKSKVKLDEFYKNNQSEMAEVESMLADFHF